MEIKNRYIIGAIVVLLVASFCGGWFACSRCSIAGIDELEERADIAENKLNDATERAGTIADGLRWATRANYEITATIRSIAEENRRITQAIGNLGIGITGDIETISGLEERMDYYINQATKPE